MRLASNPLKRHWSTFEKALRRIWLPGRRPHRSIDHRRARVDRRCPLSCRSGRSSGRTVADRGPLGAYLRRARAAGIDRTIALPASLPITAPPNGNLPGLSQPIARVSSASPGSRQRATPGGFTRWRGWRVQQYGFRLSRFMVTKGSRAGRFAPALSPCSEQHRRLSPQPEERQSDEHHVWTWADRQRGICAYRTEGSLAGSLVDQVPKG